MANLVVIGGVALDYLSRVDGVGKSCTRVLEYSENIGGMGYNTAVTTAHLGVSTRLVSAVGRDFPDLQRVEGLDFELRRTEGMTTRSFLFFDDKDERVYFYRGSYHEIDVEGAKSAIEGADWAHFAGVAPCFSELIEAADEEGKATSLNPGYDIFHYDPKDKLIKALIEKSDYMVLSSAEARHLNKPVEGLVNGAVIVTMGKNGSVVAEKGGRTQIPAYEVDAESPFGAGDTYTGTFIAAMMGGKAPVESARLASAAASFAVEERTTTPELAWDKIEKRARKL